MTPTAPPTAVPAMTALAEVEDKAEVAPVPAAQNEAPPEITMAAEPAVETEVVNSGSKSAGIKSEAADITAAYVAHSQSSSAFTSAQGSAAAPAPAKEKENESTMVESEAASASHTGASTYRSASTTDAPSFAGFGEGDSEGSGVGKKALMGAVALLALAALGYLGYTNLGKFTSFLASQHASTPQVSKPPAPAPVPMSSPAPAPSTSTPGQPSSAAQTVTLKTAPATLPDKPSADAGNFR